MLTANGIHVNIFDQLRPTPELSFALRETNSIAGINITASHNPKEYNGYKVYWSDLANVGSALAPEQAVRAVEMLQADALQIHLNAAQELVMPEGDRDFRDWAERIAAIAAAVGVPVVVKEVGFGLSRRTIMTLERTGVTAVDVAFEPARPS